MTELFNESIERTILGSILLDNEVFFEAEQEIRAEDFALSSHRVIYRQMADMIRAGNAVDPVIQIAHFINRQEVHDLGGAAYISSLTDGVSKRAPIKRYLGILKEKSTLRSLRGLGRSIAAGAEDASATAEGLLGDAESRLLELRAGSSQDGDTLLSSAVVPFLDRLAKEHTRTGDLLGLPTGIASIDAITRGFQDGEVTQFGARSGVGKSAFMIQAPIENCRQGTPVLLFSLEMTREQILRRMVAAISGVPFPKVRDGKWASAQELQAINDAAGTVAEWPLHVVDASGIRIEKLIATARLKIRRLGVKLIGVDYAQIVGADGRDERLRVAAVSRGLTRLAKDEGVPVLVLSQLSRAEKGNANRRPTMSDLRESSQLENDAHCVILLHRTWDEDAERMSSDGEIIIAKQRSGETGVFPVTFDRRSLMFGDAQRNQQSVAAQPQVIRRQS
jgi:replicative DNA helicase